MIILISPRHNETCAQPAYGVTRSGPAAFPVTLPVLVLNYEFLDAPHAAGFRKLKAALLPEIDADHIADCAILHHAGGGPALPAPTGPAR